MIVRNGNCLLTRPRLTDLVQLTLSQHGPVPPWSRRWPRLGARLRRQRGEAVSPARRTAFSLLEDGCAEVGRFGIQHARDLNCFPRFRRAPEAPVLTAGFPSIDGKYRDCRGWNPQDRKYLLRRAEGRTHSHSPGSSCNRFTLASDTSRRRTPLRIRLIARRRRGLRWLMT